MQGALLSNPNRTSTPANSMSLGSQLRSIPELVDHGSGTASQTGFAGQIQRVSASLRAGFHELKEDFLTTPRPESKLDAISMMYYTAPVQLGIFFVSSIYLEGPLEPTFKFLELDVG